MAETIISDFQSGHSWVKSGVPGTVSDDTSVYKFGTQSLKLVTDGAAGECKIRWTGISPAINFTNRFPLLWVRINDMTNLNRLWLYAASTAWTAYYTWKPSDAPSHWLDSGGSPHGSNDTWLPISMSFGEAVTLGAPDKSAIVAFQLYAQDKNATAVTINWGGLHMVDIASSAGVLTFAFDDCWDSIYNEGYGYLSTVPFPGVSYLAHEDVGAANRMTLANLQTMYGAGWDIAGHGATELDAVGDIDAELQDIQGYLNTNGFVRGSKELALPGGVWNETTVMPAVKKYFRTCRTIIPYAETRPPGDLYKLRVFEMFNTTTLANAEAAVDQAVTNKEWLIFVFHKLVAVPAASIEWAIADFQDLVDYVVASGISVKTITGVMGVPSGASEHPGAKMIAQGIM